MIPREEISTKTIIIVPFLREKQHENKSEGGRSSQLEEALGLAEAIDLDVLAHEMVNITKPRPSTLLGSGKVEEIGQKIAELHIELAVVDGSLSPVQQRNLEKAWNCKVIDRTALILEIFGQRARTKEGVLQVELAHLNYQKGRLVRSWTHLERQRGGTGFLGGPGETQIEADRRELQDKIVRIKRELETVVKTRKLHREKRQKTPYPVVALVGYTNAGKSTLFNRLTGADVLAKDMLFATLDPTLRRLKLPHGDTIILSDTVGFISKLPTHLVAAFRATLEEVTEADLILHVRDMSDTENAAHAEDVNKILKDLNVDVDNPKHIIEVWNKIDLLEDNVRTANALAAQSSTIPAFPVSAQAGTGLDSLILAVEKQISGTIKRQTVTLRPHDLALLDWIYDNASNITRKSSENGDVIVELDLTHAAQVVLNTKLKQAHKTD